MKNGCNMLQPTYPIMMMIIIICIVYNCICRNGTIITSSSNIIYSPSIIRIIKLRKMRWAGHVERMGAKRNA
jgi:hypothetical protein